MEPTPSPDPAHEESPPAAADSRRPIADDPIDAELGRVAAQMDAEIRAEQADYEAMGLQALQRARRLADVAREWMVHGDTVEVQIGGQALTGRILHVGSDLLVLATPLLPAVDVALARGPLLRRVVADPQGVTPEGTGPRTFVARMTEHEVDGAAVVIALDDGTQLDGRVLAVAVDHVLVGSMQGTQAVPLGRISMVWPDPGR